MLFMGVSILKSQALRALTTDLWNPIALELRWSIESCGLSFKRKLIDTLQSRASLTGIPNNRILLASVGILEIKLDPSPQSDKICS